MRPEDKAEIDLPLKNVIEGDVYGALLVNGPSNETFKDGILKLETWIMNFAEEQIAPLRECGEFTEDEIEAIKKKCCVISPLTLSLYCYWLQMEDYIKMPDSEKEKILLEKIPDRFKARFKGNAANRQAREITIEEETAKNEGGDDDNAEAIKRKQSMTFVEFLKEFGKAVKEELGGGEKHNEGQAA